jgi:hypothetical protein
MRSVNPALLIVVLVSVSVVCGQGCSSSTTPSGDVPIGDVCTDDAQCVAGAACDARTGVCVPANGHPNIALGASCTYDAECGSGFCSDQGVCVGDPYGAGAQQTGFPCVMDADCLSGTCDIHTDSCN